MNILYLAHSDWANVGYKMSLAIKQVPGWDATSVSFNRTYIDYNKEVFAPTKRRLERLVRAADVVHVFDDWPRFRQALLGKPLVVTYNGTYYRNHARMCNLKDRNRKVYQTCTTVDLTAMGPEWLPVPLPPTGYKVGSPKKVPWRVGHAPTSRAVKGTRHVIAAMKSMPDVEFDLIERVGIRECLARKSRCHIYVDQFELGYGVNALEAWDMGMPVIAEAKPGIIDLMKKHIGYVPFFRCPPHRLARTVRRLIDDKELYAKFAERGSKFLSCFHSADAFIERAVPIYEKVA